MQVRRRHLGVIGVALQHLVIVLDGSGRFVCAPRNLAVVKQRIAGKVIVRVRLDQIPKFSVRHGILACHVIAVGAPVHRLR